MLNQKLQTIKYERKCKVCGKDVGCLSVRAVHSSTLKGDVCYDCLSKPEAVSKLVIPDVTDLENDLILNGIRKSDFFNIYSNGLTWYRELAKNCVLVIPRQIDGVVSSLVKKGMLIKNGNDERATIQLTAEGYCYYLKNSNL